MRPPEGWQPPTAILKGDINTDGKVNIIDLTTLIDHLLGGGGTINHDAADVDNKNGVTIADLAALIDLLLTNTLLANEFRAMGIDFKSVLMDEREQAIHRWIKR